MDQSYLSHYNQSVSDCEVLMGGHAYLIPGTVESRLWQDTQHSPSPTPPESLWRKITGLGHSGAAQTLPRVTMYPNGDRQIELRADPLPDCLIPDFLGWVKSRLAIPSQASAVGLEYLKQLIPTLYVRGEQRPTEPKPAFYVQISFSGCAGMAETSSRLAAHWTALWYRADQDRLAREYLAPFGFQPDPYDAAQDEPLLFLPLGELGYAEYIPSEDSTFRPRVELDQSVLESRPDGLDVERLREMVGGHMTAQRCRCQLCEPAFGDVPFD
jgi:hypothetical protein